MSIVIFFFSHTDDERDLVILKNYEEHLKESRKMFHDQLLKTEQAKEVRPWSGGYNNKIFMFISAVHDILNAHKFKI